MYDLYIANKNYSSWSLRPWVLMRELGIPFREHLLIFGDESQWEPFRQISPSGKVPCLKVGTMVVWDSMGITEFLAEQHAQDAGIRVWPHELGARAWARSAAAEMHSSFAVLRDRCTMNCGIRVKLHDMPPALMRDIARIDALWCDGLARFGGPFLAGEEFTAVDAFFAPVAFRIQTYGLTLSDTAMAYAERLRALPSMVEWLEAGLAEPWRDEGHEAEVRRTGTVLEDLRAKPR